jgi:lysophospholipid acyltransferase (LPLAT)-like uncharacterized protein
VSGWKLWVTGILGQGLVSGLFATTRWTEVGHHHLDALRSKGQRVVFVFWHGEMLPLIQRHRHEDIVCLVSQHGDGEYVTQILHRKGFGTARGSSTRGGSKGLRELLRAARDGHDLAVTPDGPKGPARVFKPGALVAAQLTGLPMLPLAVSASSAWRTRSWDGFMVPRPFARIRIVYGAPVWVPRGCGDAEMARLSDEVASSLGALAAEAARGVDA